MVYDDYTWTTKYNDDDPRVKGAPDSTFLARTEGWEMLYFINSCSARWGWSDTGVLAKQKLEKLIRLHVPKNMRSQSHILAWIEEGNWKPYWDNI